MKFLLPIVVMFLFTSCSKENVDGFDQKIQYAQDFKIDPASGDTVFTFVMPSAFTPNDDGLNDVYYVFGSGIDPATFEMRVFTREGNLVYYVEDIRHGYDGTVMGIATTNGAQVYAIRIEVADTLGELHQYAYDILQFQ